MGVVLMGIAVAATSGMFLASKQQMLIKEADKLRDRAQELRKQKAAGTTP